MKLKLIFSILLLTGCVMQNPPRDYKVPVNATMTNCQNSNINITISPDVKVDKQETVSGEAEVDAEVPVSVVPGG